MDYGPLSKENEIILINMLDKIVGEDHVDEELEEILGMSKDLELLEYAICNLWCKVK